MESRGGLNRNSWARHVGMFRPVASGRVALEWRVLEVSWRIACGHVALAWVVPCGHVAVARNVLFRHVEPRFVSLEWSVPRGRIWCCAVWSHCTGKVWRAAWLARIEREWQVTAGRKGTCGHEQSQRIGSGQRASLRYVAQGRVVRWRLVSA